MFLYPWNEIPKMQRDVNHGFPSSLYHFDRPSLFHQRHTPTTVMMVDPFSAHSFDCLYDQDPLRIPLSSFVPLQKTIAIRRLPQNSASVVANRENDERQQEEQKQQIPSTEQKQSVPSMEARDNQEQSKPFPPQATRQEVAESSAKSPSSSSTGNRLGVFWPLSEALQSLLTPASFDVKETQDAFEVEAKLPFEGFDKDNLCIEFSEHDGVLSISGEQRQAENDKKQEEAPEPVREERKSSQEQSNEASEVEAQVAEPELPLSNESNKVEARIESREEEEEEEEVEVQGIEPGLPFFVGERAKPQNPEIQPNLSPAVEKPFGSYTRFEKKIMLPKERVRGEDIKASFKSGVLRIVIPKVQKELVKSKKISIE